MHHLAPPDVAPCPSSYTTCHQVKNQQGRLVLAKLDVDKHEALAASLQVRSLPTVFGVFQVRGAMTQCHTSYATLAT